MKSIKDRSNLAQEIEILLKIVKVFYYLIFLRFNLLYFVLIIIYCLKILLIFFYVFHIMLIILVYDAITVT